MAAFSNILSSIGSGIFGKSTLGQMHWKFNKGVDLVIEQDDATLPAGLYKISAKNSRLQLVANTASGGDFSDNVISLDIDNEGVCRHRMIKFEHEPVCVAKIGAGAATGTAGDENLIILPNAQMEYHILGTQTIVAPKLGTGGLDVNGMDQTANDGAEYTFGITARSPAAFVVGTDPDFFAEIGVSIADVSGSDDLAFGFRKAEAYQANVDDYDEQASLNVISGNINIETILNGAATTTTDTTDDWADGESHVLRVNVSSAGVVTYEIDGAAPTVTAAFTFDDGEVVVPFLYVLNDTDVAGAVEVDYIRYGHVN